MEKKDILTYLEEMKGRVLKIYKGGPESKTGKLLDVNKEIITIKTEDDQVVYYQLKHIKSIIENTMSEFLSAYENNDTNKIIKANNFVELLSHLKKEVIHINGGGPAHQIGRMMDFNPDYLVLQTKDHDLIYYQLEHIKSITPIVNNQSNESDSDMGDYRENSEYIEGTHLYELLKKMKNHWIVINGKSPENIEGVLVDFTKDHIMLVHHEEVFRISTYHINNLRLAVKKKGKKHNKEKAAQDENKAD